MSTASVRGRVVEVESSSPDAGASDTEAPDPDENEATADESAEPGAADAADETAGDAEAAPPRRPVLRWVAGVVLAVVLAAAGYEGWLLFAHHQKEVAAAEALGAAQSYTLALTSVDPNAIDKNFAEVLDGATGDFKHMYAESSEQLRKLLIENKAAAHGTVIEAAVKSATKTTVEVMLFVDQSVSNAAAPEPQIDRSRIVMTMEKVDGRWLAAKVDMP